MCSLFTFFLLIHTLRFFVLLAQPRSRICFLFHTYFLILRHSLLLFYTFIQLRAYFISIFHVQGTCRQFQTKNWEKIVASPKRREKGRPTHSQHPGCWRDELIRSTAGFLLPEFVSWMRFLAFPNSML